MGTRMQACVDVGGDREQKHEAPVDDEPEDEPAALDIGGDREAPGLTSDAKGKCPRQRRPYWRFGRRRHTAAACSFDMQRLGQTILEVLQIVERSLQRKYQHVARTTGAQLGR